MVVQLMKGITTEKTSSCQIFFQENEACQQHILPYPHRHTRQLPGFRHMFKKTDTQPKENETGGRLEFKRGRSEQNASFPQRWKRPVGSREYSQRRRD